ncbi:hypothetical protein GCM10023178_24520 [Actinomadura luteofluorescens]
MWSPAAPMAVDAELRKAEQRETARVGFTDLLSTVTTTLATIAADDDEQVTRGMEDIARYVGSVRRTTRTTTGTRTGGGMRAPRAAGGPGRRRRRSRHPRGTRRGASDL